MAKRTMRDIAGVGRTAQGPQQPIREAIQDFLQHRINRGRSPETVEWYEQHLRLFFSTLLDTKWPVGEITDSVLLGLSEQVRRKKGVSPITYNGYLRAVKAFLRWCEDFNRPHQANLRILEKIDVDEKVPDHLTEDELGRLLDAFDDDDVYGVRNKAVLMLMVDTGMRISEALGIRVCDVDLPRIRLTETKGNRDRVVGVTEPVELHLKRWIKLLASDDPEQYLFPSRDNPRLSKRQFTEKLKDAARKAGISKRVYNHLMRHTWATSAVNNGMDIAKIQKALGHSDISMALKYAEMQDETAIKASQEASPMNRIGGKKSGDGTTLRGRKHKTE